MSYRFDGVVVEPATFRLLKGGVPARIEPKALELLIFLIERRDRVVAKQELLDEVWRGTVVTENALSRSIAHIRKVLGDDLNAPRYIATIPTKGYRFIAELGEAPSEAPPFVAAPSPSPEPPRAARKGGAQLKWIVAFVLVMTALVFAALFAIEKYRVAKRPFVARTSGDVPPSSITARPLSAGDRVQAFPSFSPDANRVVYSVIIDGTPQLFIASIDGTDESQLTRRPDGATQPAWSPDGKWIAFVSVRRGGIFVIPVLGGEARQLTRSGARPAWSPDSRELAFQTAEYPDIGSATFDAQPQSSISIVDLATQRVSPLTKPGQPVGGHGAPSWRGDGKRLAFSTCDLEYCAIATIARDGSGLETIVTDTRRLMSPVFGRDGTSLHYILVRYPDSLLLSVSVDANGVRTANPERIRRTEAGVMQHLTISRDGYRFAWTVANDASDLFAVNVDSRDEPQQLTRNANSRTTFPTFSPDGSKIAFCATYAKDDAGVWVADTDGKKPKPLAVGPGLKQHTHWSRTGWDVQYYAWRDGPTLFEASLITGKVARISNLPRDSSAPVLSPDKRAVAMNRSVSGATAVWTAALDGMSMSQRTKPEQFARFPVWSPTGNWLAVQVRNRNGGSVVGIVPPREGPLKIITGGPGESWPYSWSPNESHIAFAGHRDGVWNVYAVSLDNGTTRRITNNDNTARWIQTPVWSPDGKRIAYEAGMTKGNIWVSEPRL